VRLDVSADRRNERRDLVGGTRIRLASLARAKSRGFGIGARFEERHIGAPFWAGGA